MTQAAGQAGARTAAPRAEGVGSREGVWQTSAFVLSRPQVRLALWIGLLALTAAIFAVPLRVSWDFSAVQSVHVFDNVVGFGALYYAWLATWGLLVVSSAQESGQKRGQTLALVVIFSLVFVGFWLRLHRGTSGDAFGVAALMNSINAEGAVSATSPGYSTFPGAGILGAVIGQVTGITALDTTFFLALLQLHLFAALFYMLMVHHSGQAGLAHQIAPWAIVLATCSSVPFFSLFGAFDARSNSIILLFPLWLLVTANYIKSGYQPRWGILVIVTLAALTITHFVTAIVAAMLLSVLMLWRASSRQRLVSWTLVAFGWITVAAWEMVTPFGFWYSLVNGGLEAIEEFFAGAVLEEWFRPIEASSYFQRPIPFWADITYQVWLALILGLSLLALLAKLPRARHLSQADKWELSGLFAVGILSVLLLILEGSEPAINRTLMYAPFVCIPMAFAFVCSLRPVMRIVTVTMLAGLLVALSFPTFLAFNREASQLTQHTSQIAGGRLLQQAVSKDEAVRLYGPGVESYLGYYLPTSTNLRIYLGDLRVTSEAHLWRQMDGTVTEFLESDAAAGMSLAAFSQRWREPFLRFFGKDPTEDHRWQDLQLYLAESTRFYDNGPVIYFGKWDNP